MYVFDVSYTLVCKPGLIFSNKFKFSYPFIAESYQDVEDDIFDCWNQFQWNNLEFEYYTDPDIKMIAEYPSKSDLIKYKSLFERKTKPTFIKIHKKNGTYNGGGGGGLSTGVKVAALGYASYKIGKSNLTG